MSRYLFSFSQIFRRCRLPANSKNGGSKLTCPEMKKVLSMLASIGAGGWRESAGTEAVEVV